MGIPNGPIPSFQKGSRLLNGSDVQKLADLNSCQANVTAKAGGTKAAATQITGCNVEVSVCATNGDSVILPKGYAGLKIFIANAGAADLQVFGKDTDTINGVATATGVTQADPLSALYVCIDVTAAGVGQWYRVLSA